MSDQPDFCEFCEIDGFGNHAPRCPVFLEGEIERLQAEIAHMTMLRASEFQRAEAYKFRLIKGDPER